jgi:hypothetical protein
LPTYLMKHTPRFSMRFVQLIWWNDIYLCSNDITNINIFFSKVQAAKPNIG